MFIGLVVNRLLVVDGVPQVEQFLIELACLPEVESLLLVAVFSLALFAHTVYVLFTVFKAVAVCLLAFALAMRLNFALEISSSDS